ncbi:hypothetical protein [Rhodococcus wratislaviensis]|uniref:hypothetical protein n=1 Tax=Rhodococcus wratislaviensis TaxID=44752 RepID=UPI0036689F6D
MRFRARLESKRGIRGVPLTIPDGVWTVHIEAVGGRGGDSCCGTVAPGGRGAVAGGDAWLVPGSTVYVRVGENGHGGGSDAPTQVEGGGGSGGTTDWRRNTTPPNVNGGDGGGLSSVLLDTGRSSVLVPHHIDLPLVIAAGGGGGAGWYGGGGGAAGGRIGGTGEADEPPGGGGGGLSLVPSGGTIGLSAPDSVPSVVVTFELP